MTPFSPIRLILQSEGLSIAGAGLLAYHVLGGSWTLFSFLILAPDLLMIGYFAGPRVGSLCYNIAHSYLAPLALAGSGLFFPCDLVMQIAVIWAVHIGADRAMGYGLKYASGFKATHLNVV